MRSHGWSVNKRRPIPGRRREDPHDKKTRLHSLSTVYCTVYIKVRKRNKCKLRIRVQYTAKLAHVYK